MFYRMTVAGLERDLPICPVNDKLYIAGFVIFGDQELTVACARELLKRAPAYDYILTAEAKGIPLAHEMARQAGDAKYILARKGPKLYMRDIFSVTVNSITTAKEQKLYLDASSKTGGREWNAGGNAGHIWQKQACKDVSFQQVLTGSALKVISRIPLPPRLKPGHLLPG